MLKLKGPIIYIFFALIIFIIGYFIFEFIKFILDGKEFKIKYKESKTKYQNNTINNEEKKYNEKQQINKNKQYIKKDFITQYEMKFFTIINNQFGQKYKVQAQIPLSSLINKIKSFENEYQNELYRTIDIGIFDKKTYEPLLMIEINDQTHKNYNRYQRDTKVREILEESEIPLITFYSYYDNKASYIIKKIKENLPEE